MKTLESQTHVMARTAILGPSGFKGCLQRPDVCMNKSDLRASESLTQLKLMAEKLIQEQASVRTDLQVTYSKLEKSEQDVRSLETRLHDTKTENALLRLKQQEALKLWESLESKFSSTGTFCNQLMETLQQLASQVNEAEKSKALLEKKVAERSNFHQEMKLQVEELFLKKQNSERIATNWETEYGELKKLQQQLKTAWNEEITRVQQLQAEKAEVTEHLRTTDDLLHQEKEKLGLTEMQRKQLQNDAEMRSIELEGLRAQLVDMQKKKDLECQALEAKLSSLQDRNNELQQDFEIIVAKAHDLDVANVMAKENANKLLVDIENCNDLVNQERQAKEDMWAKVKDLELAYQELAKSKAAMEKYVKDLEQEAQVRKSEHETSHKNSIVMIQKLEDELVVTCRRADDLVEEKLEMVQCIQNMEVKLAVLSLTAKNLASMKDQLVTEKSALLSEANVANENVKQLVEEKMCEIEKLKRTAMRDEEALATHQAEISLLQKILSDKDHVIMCLKHEQKLLQEQHLEAIEQKASAEKLSFETRKNAETQLETKLMEVNKHIKEISERNDEEMREITKRCKNETEEAIEKQEQRAASLLAATKEECEIKIEKAHEQSLENEKGLVIEHNAQMREMMQNHEAERTLLVAQHQAELKQKLEEEGKNWVGETDKKINELEKRHTEEIRKLHADNTCTRSKVDDKVLKLEKQVIMLQEQLKQEKLKAQQDLVAATRKHEEALHGIEVNRKTYEDKFKQAALSVEISLKKELEETKQKLAVWEEKRKSLKRDDSKNKFGNSQSVQEQLTLTRDQLYQPGAKGAHAISRMNDENKESNTDKANCENRGLPTHSKTVTHHEYEVATSDGRKTITRKRTKSTVMFESPLDVKRIGNRKSSRISSQHKKAKPSRIYAKSMGDLFGGKSLDPYSEDPYAFN